ncbi:MAG: inorganic diphosphatase [bacterium]
MTTNPWHVVSAGNNVPEFVNSIIEIPSGSKSKYELDKESGLLKMDRVLFSSVHYPANYGFIPQTLSDDNDPLDILVISSVEVVPLCIVEAKIIGLMTMIDEEERDDKIIAVAKNDMSVNYISDVHELPPHTTTELKRFFEDYKKLEHKKVFVEQFLGKQEAYKIIIESMEAYKKKYLTISNY